MCHGAVDASLGISLNPNTHDYKIPTMRDIPTIDAFLADRKAGQPWLYFFGTTTTHRMWIKGSGKKHWGIEPDALQGRIGIACHRTTIDVPLAAEAASPLQRS